jgi:hypothetical protein
LSEEFQGFLKASGVRHRPADPKHQQADGEVEVHIKTFKNQLAIMLQGMPQVQWEDALLTCARNMNQTVCVATQRSPYEVLFGQVPNRVIDNKLRLREEKLSDIRDKVIEKSDIYKEKQVEEYNRLRRERDILQGTSVWVRNNKVKWSDPYWVGPYNVVGKNENSYKLESPQKPGYYLIRNIKDIKVNVSRVERKDEMSQKSLTSTQVNEPQKVPGGSPQKVQLESTNVSLQESLVRDSPIKISTQKMGSATPVKGKLTPKLDQRISVYWSKQGKYYPGTIKEDLGKGYYGITYDDENSDDEPIMEKLTGRGRANWKEEEEGEKGLNKEDEV